MKLLGAEQPRGIARGHQGQGVIFELRPMTLDRGELSGGEPADVDDERRRCRERAERIGVCDAEDFVRRLAVYASLDEGRRDMSDDRSHAAGRHRDVVQRRAILAQRSHGRRGPLVNGDVIGMTVEAVFAERDHHVRTKPADGAADVRFEPSASIQGSMPSS